MVEKLSGVFTTIDTLGFTPDQAVSTRAIGLIGTMFFSGSVNQVAYHNDGNGAWDFATAPAFSGSDLFSSSAPNGTVFEVNSLTDARTTLGVLSGSINYWVDGSPSGGYTGFDAHHGLLRIMEVIYTINPAAKVKFCILSGVASGATVSVRHPNLGAELDGTSEALNALREHNDIDILLSADREFRNLYLTSATSASTDDFQSERIYFGGVSMETAFSGSSAISGFLNSFDVSAFTAFQDEDGRSSATIGNFNFGFTDGDLGNKEVGGMYLAAHVAGVVSSLTEDQTILRRSATYIPKYNGKTKHWTQSQLETNYDNRMVSVRFEASSSPSLFFEKGLSFTPTTSAWTLITRRRIIDRVARDVRAILKAGLGKPNTTRVRDALTNTVRRRLRDLVEIGLLTGTPEGVVFVNAGDVSNGIMRASVTVTPVTETQEVQFTVGVKL